MNKQGFPPPQKLFAAFRLGSFLDMPPFLLHAESFFLHIQCEPRTHYPAMNAIPKVHSFQVIALFFRMLRIWCHTDAVL